MFWPSSLLAEGRDLFHAGRGVPWIAAGPFSSSLLGLSEVSERAQPALARLPASR
jgi:hypothetical protein